MSATQPENQVIPTALIVLDMQESFLKSIAGGQGLVDRCRFAVEAAILLSMTVLYTEQVPEKLGHVMEELKALVPDALVFEKTAFPALQADGLLSCLCDEGIEHLLIAGLETPICVYQTSLEAVEKGLSVTVLEDCVGCRRPDDGRSALGFLRTRTGCHVLPSETVFYSILHEADHPQFREFTSLVKKYS